MDDLTFTFQENKNRAKLEEVYKPMEKREDLPENNAYNLKQTVRYRPGQAPHWVKDEDSSDEEDTVRKQPLKIIESSDEQLIHTIQTNQSQTKRRERHYEPIILDNKEDIIEESNAIKSNESITNQETEESILQRRMRVRQKQEEEEEEEEEMPIEEEEQEQEEEEEDEEDDEDDDDEEEEEEEEEIVLAKPVFIPKEFRNIIKAKEEKEKQLEELKTKKQYEDEIRKAEVHTEVLKILEKEEIDKQMKDLDKDDDKPDDTDYPDDQAEEYELWKVRELKRIQLYLQQKQQLLDEKKETERRSKLTDEQRKREDEELIRKGLKKGETEKKQWSFMQKYYHKGAFYMDEDSIRDKNDVRNQDYSEPTASDAHINEATPAVMQKRDFGKKSQTKWTHLTNEDTTQWDNPWFQKDKARGTYNKKLAGYKGDLNDAGRKRRKFK